MIQLPSNYREVIRNLSEEDLIELEYHLLELHDKNARLSRFVKEAWHVLEPGTTYIPGWHIDAVCEHLEAVTDGQINRLIINIPPGTMKSLLTCVMWPAWEWGARKLDHYRIVGCSYQEKLAVRDSLKMKRLVSSDWYKKLYPHVSISSDQNSKSNFDTSRYGKREACAAPALTGYRGDRLIIDDPMSVVEAQSKKVIESKEIWFSEAVQSRVNDAKTSAILMIMQRLNERDPTGVALAKELGYEHLMLPMEFEAGRKCFTSIGFSDPREHEGQLLFPEKFKREEVDRLKKSLGQYAYAGQYQQRPAPAEGGIIKSDWWGQYDLEFDEDFITIINPEFDYILQSWDTAFKEGTQNDYSVCNTYGVNKTGAYQIDRFKKKLNYPDLLQVAKELGRKYRPSCILIEDKASGQSLIQSLKKETNLPIKEYKIKKDQDKMARLHAISTYIESGRVFLPKNSNWVDDYKYQMGVFPGGSHDDDVDATSMALNHIFLKQRPEITQSNYYQR